jgi:tRNA(Ile)-lysidine synthase
MGNDPVLTACEVSVREGTWRRTDAMSCTNFHDLRDAVAGVPAGAWGIAVSGGADSVALLRLLHARGGNVPLRIVHLNHQTRGAESDEDERFVARLGGELGVPCSIARREEIERSMTGARLPHNPSARYRALRLEWYRRTVERYGLDGVVLAHHADDQAETVWQRLLRGAGYLPLAGIRSDARVPVVHRAFPPAEPGAIGGSRGAHGEGVRLLRPLLGVRRRALRQYLKSIGQAWREDASNASDAYQRNRVRKALAASPEALTDSLLDLAEACRALREWTEATAPTLGQTFEVSALRDLPALLAETSARRWLAQRGAPREQLSEAVVSQLVTMVVDAASAPRRQFPGDILVRRRRGHVDATQQRDS